MGGYEADSGTVNHLFDHLYACTLHTTLYGYDAGSFAACRRRRHDVSDSFRHIAHQVHHTPWHQQQPPTQLSY